MLAAQLLEPTRRLRSEALFKRPALVSPLAGWKSYPACIAARQDSREFHVELSLAVSYSSAVFIENIKDSRLLEQIAQESGTQIGGTLYSDALAASGPASSFIGRFEHNLKTLHQALAQP